MGSTRAVAENEPLGAPDAFKRLPGEDGSLPESNDFQLIVGFLIRVG